MARAGNVAEGRAIMKGFKRGMQRNTYNQDQKDIYEEMNDQIGEVYAHMGVEMKDCDSEEENILVKPGQT